MIDALKNTTDYDKRSVRENLKLAGWIFVWMISLTVSDKAALYGWWAAPWITCLSIGINAALGLWVIHIYRQLLKGMDDLQKSIQLEALSMAFGISLVAACSYSLTVTWVYIQDEEVSDLFMVMCVSFSAALLFNAWRYR